MSGSPRAERAARRHQVNETPLRELDTSAQLTGSNTGSTVSTLTTGNTVQTALLNDDEDVDFVGGGGGGFDDDIVEDGNGGEEEEEEEALLPPLPPLRSVFDCAHLHQTHSGWECRWCGKSFGGKHATRALNHVMKMSKNDVGVCRAVIPDMYLKRYEALSLLLSQRSAARKRSHEQKHDSVAISQDASVAMLLAKIVASW